MGRLTVAGAALPVLRLPTFTGSFGRAGWLSGASNFAAIRTWSTLGASMALASTGFGFGVLNTRGAMSLATCVGTGSSTGGGVGSATLATCTGGGAFFGTGTSVCGASSGTTAYSICVTSFWGKNIGRTTRKAAIAA